MCLSEWLHENGYKCREEMHNDMMVEGCSREEFEEQWAEIVDEFEEWCLDNDCLAIDDC